LTTSRTLLNSRSWVTGQGHTGFQCVFWSAWYPPAVLSFERVFYLFTAPDWSYYTHVIIMPTYVIFTIHRWSQQLTWR